MSKIITMKSEVTGTGNPLILVPGGLTGWKSWEPYISYFTGEGWKVVRVQLINVQYGVDNEQLPEDYSVNTESRAFEATLDNNGLKDPVDIIAWSYGALVSLDFALNNPGRIRTLTLIEPPAIWAIRNDKDTDIHDLLNLFDSLTGNITDEMLSEFLGKVGFTSGNESPRNLPQWQQWLPYKQSLRNSPAVANHEDDLQRLKDLNSPVLLVKGTGSAEFLHKIIDILSENLPDAKVIELPGGHAPHIVSRDRFLREWNKFLSMHLQPLETSTDVE